jgi:hypothetical protein
MKANVLEQGADAFAVHANTGKSTQPAQANNAAE